MKCIISKSFTFEASHILPRHPGKCSRLHGHSWKLTVSVSGPVQHESGFVVDYAILGELVKANVVDRCDHRHLGQGKIDWNGQFGIVNQEPPFGPAFYPSSENLVVTFARTLGPLVQELGPPDYVLTPAGLMKPHDGSIPEEGSVIIPATIQLEEVTLEETCTCKATWRRKDA